MKKLAIIVIAAILAVFIYMKQQQLPMYTHTTSDFLNQHNSLALVNREIENELKPNKITKLTETIGSNVQIKDTFYVDMQVIEPLTAMFAQAEKHGIHHFIINSAYRTYDEQRQIYKETGSSYALPAGHSEHETGLAIDIGSTQGMMENSEEGKWLAEHAHQFGFILRYPKDKEHITSINYEPWHFRYVGLPHSVIMYEQNLVLEEYLEWLKDEKEVTKKINGIKYNITYHSAEQNVDLDSTLSVESVDQLGGLIVTTRNK